MPGASKRESGIGIDAIRYHHRTPTRAVFKLVVVIVVREPLYLQVRLQTNIQSCTLPSIAWHCMASHPDSEVKLRLRLSFGLKLNSHPKNWVESWCVKV